MCGIIGFLYPPEDSTTKAQADLSGALTCLAHRGPDGQGDWVRSGVALGHTRLAIIDLAGGQQPMRSPDNDYAITFNGEIYNYKAIQQQLKAKGYRFQTHSDTEVILAAYQAWGKDCVQRLRGMFAFAIADYRQRTLFLARDHIGIKPLVYTWLDNRFAFASELQALNALPWVQNTKRPNLSSIYQFLRFGYIPAPETAYEQVYKLLPGHYLEVPFDATSATPQQYWQINFEPDYQKSEAEWQEIIEAALKDTVRAHLVADVPFGAFLSGGLDSTLVVDYMAQLLEQPVKTFSIGFQEDDFDERPYARQAAAKIGTEHFEEVVSADALALLPDLVKHYGEPFGDVSAVPTWHVSKLAREHVPMVLSGDGGDEFFAGYNSYRCWLDVIVSPGRPRRPLWKQLMRPALSRALPQRFPADPVITEPVVEDWLAFHNCVPRADVETLLRPEYAQTLGQTPATMSHAFSLPTADDPLARARSVDIHNYLPYDILTKVDIASMMHGLESRTPFVDVRIAELAATIPMEILIHQKEGIEGWQGKQPFRQVLKRNLPDRFVDRPKQGFGIPIDTWLFGKPQALAQLKERLLSQESRISQWLSSSAIEKSIAERAGTKVWHLLVLEEWMEQNCF